MDRSKDAVQRDHSSALKNNSSGVIQVMKQGGNTVKQKSDRGRMSRESIPSQKPSQTFQGGKTGQSGGSFTPKIGGGLPGGGGHGGFHR